MARFFKIYTAKKNISKIKNTFATFFILDKFGPTLNSKLKTKTTKTAK